MSIELKENARKLRIKYEAERALLIAWQDALTGVAPDSEEADLTIEWRNGWKGYLNLVIDIGQEKIEALQDIMDAESDAITLALSEKLEADYKEEIVHYNELATESGTRPTKSIAKLTKMLKQEANDRQDYVNELTV